MDNKLYRKDPLLLPLGKGEKNDPLPLARGGWEGSEWVRGGRMIVIMLSVAYCLLFVGAIARPAFAQAPDTGLSNFTTLVPGADADPSTPEGEKYRTGNYTLCDFFRLLANAVKILFELAAGGAIFLFFWIAFGMISNWGEAEKAQGAFKGLKNIFYGLAIMIGAWFVVNALIVTLTAKYDDKGAGMVFDKPWNNLSDICKGL